jgi:hypothetical protein
MSSWAVNALACDSGLSLGRRMLSASAPGFDDSRALTAVLMRRASRRRGALFFIRSNGADGTPKDYYFGFNYVLDRQSVTNLVALVQEAVTLFRFLHGGSIGRGVPEGKPWPRRRSR